jgi:hypothetical protein
MWSERSFAVSVRLAETRREIIGEIQAEQEALNAVKAFHWTEVSRENRLQDITRET